MRVETVEALDKTEAYEVCPWAAEVVEVEGGFKCFESVDDADLFKSHQTVRIYADQENNAEEFWKNFWRFFRGVAGQISKNGSAEISLYDWESIQKLTGFGDGPMHAPYALLEEG